MVWHKVGRRSDFRDLESMIVRVNDVAIGIYKFNDAFYAYLDWCPHQGGPACEGNTFGDTIAEILPNGSRGREYTSTDQVNITCPWHGFDFHLTDGTSRTNRRLRLKKFEVRVDEECVYLDI